MTARSNDELRHRHQAHQPLQAATRGSRRSAQTASHQSFTRGPTSFTIDSVDAQTVTCPAGHTASSRGASRFTSGAQRTASVRLRAVALPRVLHRRRRQPRPAATPACEPTHESRTPSPRSKTQASNACPSATSTRNDAWTQLVALSMALVRWFQQLRLRGPLGSSPPPRAPQMATMARTAPE